jgi:hypothetical protein
MATRSAMGTYAVLPLDELSSCIAADVRHSRPRLAPTAPDVEPRPRPWACTRCPTGLTHSGLTPATAQQRQPAVPRCKATGVGAETGTQRAGSVEIQHSGTALLVLSIQVMGGVARRALAMKV